MGVSVASILLLLDLFLSANLPYAYMRVSPMGLARLVNLPPNGIDGYPGIGYALIFLSVGMVSMFWAAVVPAKYKSFQ